MKIEEIKIASVKILNRYGIKGSNLNNLSNVILRKMIIDLKLKELKDECTF